jgi:hypothetical protein
MIEPTLYSGRLYTAKDMLELISFYIENRDMSESDEIALLKLIIWLDDRLNGNRTLQEF